MLTPALQCLGNVCLWGGPCVSLITLNSDTAEMEKGEESDEPEGAGSRVGDDAGHAAVTDTNGAASGSDSGSDGASSADAVGDDAGHAAVTDTNGAASGSDGASSASDSQEPSSASSDSDHGDTDEEWQTEGLHQTRRYLHAGSMMHEPELPQDLRRDWSGGARIKKILPSTIPTLVDVAQVDVDSQTQWVSVKEFLKREYGPHGSVVLAGPPATAAGDMRSFLLETKKRKQPCTTLVNNAGVRLVMFTDPERVKAALGWRHGGDVAVNRGRLASTVSATPKTVAVQDVLRTISKLEQGSSGSGVGLVSWHGRKRKIRVFGSKLPWSLQAHIVDKDTLSVFCDGVPCKGGLKYMERFKTRQDVGMTFMLKNPDAGMLMARINPDALKEGTAARAQLEALDSTFVTKSTLRSDVIGRNLGGILEIPHRPSATGVQRATLYTTGDIADAGAYTCLPTHERVL